jgi:hypothetical protein
MAIWVRYGDICLFYTHYRIYKREMETTAEKGVFTHGVNPGGAVFHRDDGFRLHPSALAVNCADVLDCNTLYVFYRPAICHDEMGMSYGYTQN